MKGMVHVGVLKALSRLRLPVDEIIGTSIGAVIGALYASGFEVEDFEELTQELRQKDFFKLNVLKFLYKGYRHASLYKSGPFLSFLESRLGDKGFGDLRIPFFCNALSLETGGMHYFGVPGGREISLKEAVYASAALPGIFEPLAWNGEHLMDGGIADSLPLRLARARGAELIIAVDLSAPDQSARTTYKNSLPYILYRSFEISQEALVEMNLHAYGGPDLVHLKPPVGHLGLFKFNDLEELIQLGERTAIETIASHPLSSSYCAPEIVDEVRLKGRERRRFVEVKVDTEACVHCGVCFATCATDGFVPAKRGSVLLKAHNYECPRDGACAKNCPTGAIRLTYP